MKFIYMLFLIFNFLNCTLQENSVVCFTTGIIASNLTKIFTEIDADIYGKTALNVHFKEERNQYYIKVKGIAKKHNATFIETTVQYVN